MCARKFKQLNSTFFSHCSDVELNDEDVEFDTTSVRSYSTSTSGGSSGLQPTPGNAGTNGKASTLPSRHKVVLSLTSPHTSVNNNNSPPRKNPHQSPNHRSQCGGRPSKASHRYGHYHSRQGGISQAKNLQVAEPESVPYY